MKDVRERIKDLKKWLTSAYDRIAVIQESDDYDINRPMSAEESLLWSLIGSYDREISAAYDELDRIVKHFEGGINHVISRHRRTR